MVAAALLRRRHRRVGARAPRVPTNGSAWIDCRGVRRAPRSRDDDAAYGAGGPHLRRRDRPLLRSIHEVHAAAAPAAGPGAQMRTINTLQVLGELGVIGLASFAAIVVVGVGPPAADPCASRRRSDARGPRDRVRHLPANRTRHAPAADRRGSRRLLCGAGPISRGCKHID